MKNCSFKKNKNDWKRNKTEININPLDILVKFTV
jgi:hypothetical protein